MGAPSYVREGENGKLAGVYACDTGRPEGMEWNSKSNFNSNSILILAGVHTLEKNAWLGCKGIRGKWLFGEFIREGLETVTIISLL